MKSTLRVRGDSGGSEMATSKVPTSSTRLQAGDMARVAESRYCPSQGPQVPSPFLQRKATLSCPLETKLCTVCGAMVKSENLRKHYARVHLNRSGGNPGPTGRNKARRPHSRVWLGLGIVMIAMVLGVAVWAATQAQPPNPPQNTPELNISLTPSSISIPGPGIASFQLDVATNQNSSSTVSLSSGTLPIGVRIDFESTTATVSNGHPATVHAMLVLQQYVSFGSQSVDILGSDGPLSANTRLTFQVAAPTPSRQIYLVANSTGWNSTSASGVNPTIQVQRGETIDLVLETIPNDIHHYISIYPANTQPSDVSEYARTEYARSSLAHTYPSTTDIIFTFETTGSFPYYCDAHPDTMAGTIQVSP